MSNETASGTSQRSARRPPHSVVVRRAVAADAPALAAIVAQAFAEKFLPAFGTEARAIRALTPYLAAQIERRGNYVFVAVVDGIVAGTVSVSTQRGSVRGVPGMFSRTVGFWGMVRALLVLSLLGDPAPAPDEAFVEVLGVASEWRRRGIGRALMVAAEEHARALHKRRLTLYVTAHNHPAQALYRACGLTVRRKRPSVTGRVFFRAPGVWRMEKPLTP